ncbi:hypothetical protein [Marinimicrobium sp. C2-29]|uniref:hypothetical protein n=1 Tax=Marinimicrobium sp. C2-29 TaxID=3139825 RepID=UPI0031396922
MIRWAALTTVASTLLGTGCASVQTDDYAVYRHAPEASTLADEPVSVIFANPEGIEFRGDASHDDSVDSANVLYSGAAGAGGVAAQIALHATMVQGAQDRKLEKSREQANLALEPVAEEVQELQSLDPATLSFPGRFSVRPWPGDADIQSVHVETHPVFYVTENLDSLSVKNVLVLRKPGDPPEQPIYRNLVEVVSDRLIDPDSEKGTVGEGLEAAVRELYQTSVLIALDDMDGRLQAQDQQPETFRYDLDGELRLERGVMVRESCSDIVLRNLRGWLISFPKPDVETECMDTLADGSVPSS